MIKDGVRYFFVKDHRGSVLKVVDIGTGEVKQELKFSEFGEVLQDTNPGFQPFGFAGGLYDPDTKLVRFGARDYDGRIGRWLSKDPIRFDGGTPNLYEYGMNDPVNFVDSDGLSPRALCIGIDLSLTAIATVPELKSLSDGEQNLLNSRYGELLMGMGIGGALAGFCKLLPM